MQTHRTITVVAEDGSVRLDHLPFPAGEPIEIVVRTVRDSSELSAKLTKYTSGEFTQQRSEHFHAAKRKALKAEADDTID